MSNVYLKRVKALQKSMKVSVVWIENPIDIFYLSGLQVSCGLILVDRKTATLFVDGRYSEAAKKASAMTVKKRSEEVILKHLTKHSIIGFDQDHLTYGAYSQLKKTFKKTFKPLPSLLGPLRSVKDAFEIKAMKKSANLLWKGFRYAVSNLKVGMAEKELMLDFEQYVKTHGASALSFDPIIAFGPNTAMPHYHTGKRKLKASDIVLFDAGVVVDGYCSDMTRTFFFGKPKPKLKRVLDVTRKAQAAALKACKAGKSLKDLDLAARAIMKEACLEEYFVHSLGHGIGLEVHEWPGISSLGKDKNAKLKAGMVITIEPGLYFPGLGGARWEDTIAITENGYQNFYPQRLDFCSKVSVE